MAVAFDAASESHAATTPSTSEASFTWQHTPVGTPAGVLVYVFTFADADYITSVTYGGVALAQYGEAADTAGEPMRATAFFLGQPSLIPTGQQSVVVTRTNNATPMYAVAITVTAGTNRDTEATGLTTITGDGTVAEQAVTDGSPGADSVRFAGGAFGHATLPTAGANSTAVHSIDPGAYGFVVVRETTAGQGSRSVGMSSGSSDDRAIVHLAVREVLAPGLLTDTVKVSGAGFARIDGWIRVSDSVSAALVSTTLSATPSEAVKVADALTVSRALTASLTDGVIPVDTLTVSRELTASLTDGVTPADSVSAALVLAVDGLTNDVVKVADLVAATLNPEETSATEIVKVADTVTAALVHHAAVQDVVLVADTVAVLLFPLETSVQDVVLVADTANAEYGTTISTLKVEPVLVADAISVTLNPEETALTEPVKVADVATPALELSVSLTDGVLVGDNPSGNTDAEARPAESVLVADTVAVTLTPEETSQADIVLVADTVSAVLQAGAQQTDTVRVADAVTVVLDPLEAGPSDSVRVADAVTARLILLLPSETLSEGVRVGESLTLSLNPLQATPSETIEVRDSLETSGGVVASFSMVMRVPRVTVAMRVPRVTVVMRVPRVTVVMRVPSPIGLTMRTHGAYTLRVRVPTR